MRCHTYHSSYVPSLICLYDTFRWTSCEKLGQNAGPGCWRAPLALSLFTGSVRDMIYVFYRGFCVVSQESFWAGTGDRIPGGCSRQERATGVKKKSDTKRLQATPTTVQNTTEIQLSAPPFSSLFPLLRGSTFYCVVCLPDYIYGQSSRGNLDAITSCLLGSWEVSVRLQRTFSLLTGAWLTQEPGPKPVSDAAGYSVRCPARQQNLQERYRRHLTANGFVNCGAGPTWEAVGAFRFCVSE